MTMTEGLQEGRKERKIETWSPNPLKHKFNRVIKEMGRLDKTQWEISEKSSYNSAIGQILNNMSLRTLYLRKKGVKTSKKRIWMFKKAGQWILEALFIFTL